MKLKKGQVAVVTGAGAGMGAELATLLAKRGVNLALCDISNENLLKVEEKLKKYNIKVSTHVVDVSSRAEIQQFAKDVSQAHNGKVNLLFNNAGVASTKPFHESSAEDFDWCFNINVNGVIDTTRAFLPMIIEQEEGCIVNTSSVAGFYPSDATGTAYTASKFAVRGFTENLLIEARKHYPHVNVLCVHPGIICTDIINNARGIKVEFAGRSITDDKAKQTANNFYATFGYTAHEAALMIIDAVVAGKTRALVGWDAVIMDWWVRAFPRIFDSPFDPIVPLTAIILRKAYLPLASMGLAAYAYKSLKSKL